MEHRAGERNRAPAEGGHASKFVGPSLLCPILWSCRAGLALGRAGAGLFGPSRVETRTTSTKPPRLAGDSLPVPPRQAAAWKAPETKLSKEFVSATATLFQQGLADPRGCEYREIEVDVGGYVPNWADEVVKTHGWVLPAAGEQGQRFAVCWNGLVYPLAAIGKPADVRADAAAAAKGKVQAAGGFTGWYWMAYYEDHCFCHPWEGRTVAQDSPLPVKACLLLRLGEAELAEKVWNRWTSGLNGWQWFVKNDRGFDKLRHEDDKPYLKDPYLVLANLWTLALFDRAVVAHVRGDDPLALASLETLATALPAAKAEAARRGFAQPAPRSQTSRRLAFTSSWRPTEPPNSWPTSGSVPSSGARRSARPSWLRIVLPESSFQRCSSDLPSARTAPPHRPADPGVGGNPLLL